MKLCNFIPTKTTPYEAVCHASFASPYGDHVSLGCIKASDEFLCLLGGLGKPTPKRDLYLIASMLNPDEINPEVIEKLDAIYDASIRCSAKSEAHS